MLNLEYDQVLISVTGGAQDFKMLSSNLEQVRKIYFLLHFINLTIKIFNRGLLRAAENTRAWIGKHLTLLFIM